MRLLLCCGTAFGLTTFSCASALQVAADQKAFDDAKVAKAEVALGAAVQDLACPHSGLSISARLPTRYADVFELAFVVDGCGQRALYAVMCSSHGDGCTPLMVSRTQLAAPPPHAPAGVASTPAGPSVPPP